MSKPGRTLPNPTTAPPSDAPPDLSGGGDTIIEAPPDGRATRPGPQPKIRESFSNPGMATSPDVKVLNERKYDAARSKVRGMALERMPDLQVGKHLPGPPLETDEPAPVGPEDPTKPDAPAPAEPDEPKLDEKTAAQLAAKDRENRELRKKIRTIETSGMSAAKKEAKLKELAKTNPRGVAEYLGIDFQTYLMQVQTGQQTAIDIDEKPAPEETDEKTKLREENERLRANESRRVATEVITKRIGSERGEDGKLRWPRTARVGDAAVAAVISKAQDEMAEMRKLTRDEALRVVDHFLDEREAEYRTASAGDEPARPSKQPPNPRTPQRVPAKSPMEFKTAKDEADPRNRPTSRDIIARVRNRLIG